jgi:hypothetical protein
MPDLIRHPVFSWISASAGMTACAITYDAPYKVWISLKGADLKPVAPERYAWRIFFACRMPARDKTA